MEEKFDYAKAVEELEAIDALVSRSNALLKQCREYLRTVKEKIDKLDKE